MISHSHPGGAMFVRFALSLLSVAPDSNVETSVTFGELLLHMYCDMNGSSRAYQNQLEYIARRVVGTGISSDSSNSSGDCSVDVNNIKRVLLCDESRALLTHKDRVNLFKLGLLGDKHFGMVPLQVARSCFENTHEVSTSSSSSSNKQHSSGDHTQLAPQFRRAEHRSLSSVSSTSPQTVIPAPSITQLQEVSGACFCVFC
jgi:hypothetical protein